MTALAVAEKADELQSESNSDKAIDIFAKNAFRTLGVCGDATPKEISSAASSLRRANKIGKKRETTWDLPWFATQIGRAQV